MKKIFFAFGAALLLSACNSGLGSKEEAEAPVMPLPQTPGPALAADSTGQPAAGGATTVKLNPAHGQPGHRCDIPEGAPLNGAALPGAAPATNGVVMPSSPVQSAPAATARLNPPHGQPGHSCDVPVGQPLP